MEDYVLEAGKTYICSVNTLAGCSEREIQFVNSNRAKSSEALTAELERLEKMSVKSSSMTEDLRSWLRQRLAIIRQLTKSQSNPTSQSAEL